MTRPLAAAAPGILTDEEMRHFWSRFTTMEIRDMPMPAGKPDETARAYEGRRRILALREAEVPADRHGVNKQKEKLCQR